MKRIFLTVAAVVGFVAMSIAQEFKVVTIIESIVPAGAGRSRIVETKTDANIDDLTTSRTDGKTSKQGDVARADVKAEVFDETKLLNF